MSVFAPPETYPPCETPFSDHIYKTAHGVDIPLRLWPATTTSETPAPYLLWFHGGGFTGGQHARTNLWVVDGFRTRGFHVISVAYRFAPQVHMREIFQDIYDAHQWLRAHLPELVGGKDKVDINRYAVGGDSAGGTLSTLAGLKFQPPPRAIIDDCGPVNWLDMEYRGRKEPLQGLPSSGRYTDDELLAALIDFDPAHAEYISVFTFHYLQKYKTVEKLREYTGLDDYEITDRNYLRTDAFMFSAARGLTARTVFRYHGKDDDESIAAFETELKEWSSYHLLQKQTTYPPTFFIHGTADPVVPIAQSKLFAQKLKEMGVPYQEGYKEGASHVFEEFTYAKDDPIYQEIIVPAIEFVVKHV